MGLVVCVMLVACFCLVMVVGGSGVYCAWLSVYVCVRAYMLLQYMCSKTDSKTQIKCVSPYFCSIFSGNRGSEKVCMRYSKTVCV